MKKVIIDKVNVIVSVNLDQLTPGVCLGILDNGIDDNYKYMLMYDSSTKTYDMYSGLTKCMPQYQNIKLENIGNYLEPNEELYVFDTFNDMLRWKLE